MSSIEVSPVILMDERIVSKGELCDVQLIEFGYKPELQRTFTKWDMLGFGWSIVNSWSGLASILIVGIVSGGPPVIIYVWIGVCICALFIAHAFAELCSAYPISGGQYSWAAILAPPRYSRQLSYITGWFMNAGITGVCAGNNFLMANFILGIANLNNPSFKIERWHNVLLAYLFALFTAFVNVYFSDYLHRLSRLNLYWNLTAFVVTTVVMLACNDHKQSAEFVFVEFQNETGFASAGMAVMIGTIQCFYGMCCYDAPSKMIEEMNEPTKDAPQCIILSVWMGFVTGLIYLIACFFCIGDLQATAATSTGVPLIQIYYDSTGSVAGATIMILMVFISFIFTAIAGTADSSRGLWAFARDRGLPFSTAFAKVNSSYVPAHAILLSTGTQMAINSIYFGSASGLSTILTFGIFGFYMSYAMPLGLRLWAYFTGRITNIPGPYSLGKWSPLVHGVGVTFALFGSIDLCFPQLGPVTYENMNYCSVCAGGMAAISALTWYISGKNNFKGPQIDGMHTVIARGSNAIIRSSIVSTMDESRLPSRRASRKE